MAIGAFGDIVTFTPAAGNPGAGAVQTGVVIGVVPATSNRVGYNLGVKADGAKWAHECVTTSVTVLGNQSKHNG